MKWLEGVHSSVWCVTHFDCPSTPGQIHHRPVKMTKRSLPYIYCHKGWINQILRCRSREWRVVARDLLFFCRRCSRSRPRVIGTLRHQSGLVDIELFQLVRDVNEDEIRIRVGGPITAFNFAVRFTAPSSLSRTKAVHVVHWPLPARESFDTRNAHSILKVELQLKN